MNKQAATMSVFLAAFLAAAPAVRADTPAPPPPAHTRVEAQEMEFDGGDLFAWDDDDADEFDMAEGEASGGGGEERMVVRTMKHGPGMRGPGKGMGMGEGHMGPVGHHMRGAMMHERMAQLGLSQSQRERMHAIHEAQQRKAIQMRADLQLARLDMAKLMHADNPDQAALNAQIDRMARMRAEAAKSRVATHLEMRSVLTADQLKKMHEPKSMMHMAPGAMPGHGEKQGGTLHR
ncbi:MAG: Spy/CpxP family protein refolding chaperone [Candidatus Eisenbacteria bacterium]